MKTATWIRLALVLAAAPASACSASPQPTVIILGEAPSVGGGGGGGQGGASTSPPISFVTPDAATPSQGSGGATNPAGNPGASGGPSGATGGGMPSGSGVPCDVATYLAANCTSCHGNPPLPSALASLVTIDDLKATAKEDPTKNEAELSVARMQDATRPMPPGALPSAADVAILQNWINAGYPTGSCGGGAAGDGGTATPPPGPPPPSVFDKAPPFQPNTGDRAHNAGRDCMSCHLNPQGEAPSLSFGGTVYDGSGNPVAGAEVRLVDANGQATSVYTGLNGTFFQQGNGFAAPAHVGVRNASAAVDMFTALQANGGGCSSCHCTGTGCSVSAIHLP